MKKYLVLIISIASIFVFVSSVGVAQAHRSGCHRWHSCESDSGSYTCGDTGYCSQCSDNYYCHSGSYQPGWNTPSTSRLGTQNTTPSISSPVVQPEPFVGIPKTRRQLLSCSVVGNYSSMIYHLKGSRYIRSMNLKRKECFAAAQDAIDKGFRRARSR